MRRDRNVHVLERRVPRQDRQQLWRHVGRDKRRELVEKRELVQSLTSNVVTHEPQFAQRGAQAR